MQDLGREHFYGGIWRKLAVTWRFWHLYGRRRQDRVVEFHSVYKTMG